MQKKKINLINLIYLFFKKFENIYETITFNLTYVYRTMQNECRPKFLEPDLLNNVSTSYSNFRTNVKEILDEYGFVIINGILDQDEIKLAQSLLFNDLLESIDHTKIQQLDPFERDGLLNTLKKIKKSNEFPQSSLPGLTGKGFLSTHGLPQGEFAWKLRTNEKCKEIYEYLHDSNDLVVSTDLPFYTIVPTKNTNELWPHADQVIGSNLGCENSYQGILYVVESSAQKSANTVILPKSHKNQYNILLEHCAPTKFGQNFSQALYVNKILDPEILSTTMNDFIQNSRRVQMQAGSLLIFSSLTIHQGFPAGKRIAQTICWEPRLYRNENAYRSKLLAVNTGIGTTHWASLGIPHGASKLRAKIPNYSNDFHQCVFPMKNIKPYPIYKVLENPNRKSNEELEQNIFPEILQYL